MILVVCEGTVKTLLITDHDIRLFLTRSPISQTARRKLIKRPTRRNIVRLLVKIIRHTTTQDVFVITEHIYIQRGESGFGNLNQQAN